MANTDRFIPHDAAFRDRVVAADGLRATDICDSYLWQRTLGGFARIADFFSSGARSYLVVELWSQPRLQLSPRSREVLERTLLSPAQKMVSIDFGLSPSTTATVVKKALSVLGLHCTPSRTPLLLVMLARAAHDLPLIEHPRKSTFELDGRDYVILSVTTESETLRALLTPAEWDVVSMRIEGLSHAEIAAQRRTSPRTVANQLATASRRLGISGRSSLLEYVSSSPASRAS